MKSLLNNKAILAIVAFLAIELLFFRSGIYNNIVKPSSFAGMLMQRCQLAKSKGDGNVIALLGDSRLREGFSAQTFDERACKYSLSALNLSLSDSDPRVWYYFLKHVDPHCNSFKMIVFALPSYWDEGYAYGMCDKRNDIKLLLPILSLPEALQFTQSFLKKPAKLDAFAASCLKIYGFRQDLKDFLANPLERLRECQYANAHSFEADYQYTGTEKSLSGAHVVNNQIVGLPPFITPYQRQRLQWTILGLLETTPNMEFPYLRYWLERLTARYATSSTKLVFVRIPACPLSVPVQHAVHTSTIELISKQPNVIINPENTFSFLEKPEYFFDDVHLNSTGRKISSQRLSTILLKEAQLDPIKVADTTRPSSL